MLSLYYCRMMRMKELLSTFFVVVYWNQLQVLLRMARSWSSCWWSTSLFFVSSSRA